MSATASTPNRPRRGAPTRTVRVALAQLPVRVGAFTANTAAVRAAIDQAAAAGADLLVTPEMTLPGYPAEDLLADPLFLTDAEDATRQVLDHTTTAPGLTVVVGSALPLSGDLARTAELEDRRLDASPRAAANVAVAGRDGAHLATVAKRRLPTYAVCDDARHLTAGRLRQPLLDLDGVRVGLLVCEDLWDASVPAAVAAQGADLLVVLNASPYSAGKPAVRRALVSETAARTRCPVVYCQGVGGQDDLVFDGASLVADAGGRLLAAGAFCDEDFLVVDVPLDPGGPTACPARDLDGEPAVTAAAGWPTQPQEEVWQVLVRGLRDYVHRNGFADVMLGLSGGIDSAVVAAIAVDAVGADHVRGLAMPGPYSSEHSVTDALDLAGRLGIRCDVVPIGEGYHERVGGLGDLLLDAGGNPPAGRGVALENLQARLRGLTLMTMANAYGALLLTTGNRSEIALGYFTLYGDSCGTAPNPLGDVTKTTVVCADGTVLPGVYELARWRNEAAARRGEPAPIPASTLTKPPSAELAEGQVDSDSLPPYDVLDPLLVAHLEDRATFEQMTAQLAAAGMDEQAAVALVQRVVAGVARAEFKRRQGPPPLRISRQTFGRERRVPITNGWRTHPAAAGGPVSPERPREGVAAPRTATP